MAKKKKPSKTARKANASSGAAKTARMPIHAMTAAQHQRVFRALRATLKQQGVTSELSAVHFAADAQADVCEPPKVRKMVCRLVDSVPVCKPECVDP